jgi:hypothetical protein
LQHIPSIPSSLLLVNQWSFFPLESWVANRFAVCNCGLHLDHYRGDVCSHYLLRTVQYRDIQQIIGDDLPPLSGKGKKAKSWLLRHQNSLFGVDVLEGWPS